MEIARILPFTNRHCRFKLRSGREVFGVIWEVEAGEEQRLFFASVGDYERLQRDPQKPVSVIDMQPEEIVYVESLAS